jgi:hypothetical protein
MVINWLAENAICNSGWKNCGQKYFMAEELEISVGELEVVCEYLDIDLDLDFDLGE